MEYNSFDYDDDYYGDGSDNDSDNVMKIKREQCINYKRKQGELFLISGER